MPHDASHPTDEELGSFLQGRLGRTSAVSLEAHVTGCFECLNRLEGLPAGGHLVQLLSAAKTGRLDGDLIHEPP